MKRPAILAVILAVVAGFAAGFFVGRVPRATNPLDDAPLGALQRNARIVPSFSDDRVEGMKLFSIHPKSALASMGFQNGDVVVGVGDRSLKTYGDAEAALTAALGKTVLHVQRRGAPVDIPCDACLPKLLAPSPAMPEEEEEAPPAKDGAAPGAEGRYQLADGAIKRVDDVTYELSRAAVDDALAHGDQIAMEARVVPAFANGKTIGFKLFSIRPDSLFGRMGLKNGDIVVRINDIVPNAPAVITDQVPGAWKSDKVTVVIHRGPQELALNYTIK
jgi:S1-C subfamily serine protease